MSKLTKLIKSPGVFFRDYLNKRYPTINSEQGCIAEHESILIEGDFQLLDIQTHRSVDPVDVVFTWVNNKDKEWRKKFDKYVTKTKTVSVGLYAMDDARFEDHEELRFSIYSVLKYLPWVRKIYVVTDGQRPDWEIDTGKVVFVDHKEIIDEIYLPTFNSHVIEAHLHKIKGLAENFIYFNDDVFVARPLPQSHFFKENGVASLFVTKKSLKKMQDKGIETVTLSASLLGNRLLQKYYDVEIDRPLIHTYIPLKKSMYQRAWSKYENEIRLFLDNRFRSHQDLNMASFLVPWLMYIEGQAIISREICYYFNIRSNNALALYKNLMVQKMHNNAPHSFCANDFNSIVRTNSDYKSSLENFLKKYFYTK